MKGIISDTYTREMLKKDLLEAREIAIQTNEIRTITLGSMHVNIRPSLTPEQIAEFVKLQE